MNNDFDWRTMCLDAESRCAEAIRERDRWKQIADDLYSWAIEVLGDYMTTKSVKAYEEEVRGG